MKPVVCSLRRILFGNKRVLTLLTLTVLLGLCVSFGLSSCKAWRTITTTSTYQQANDSTKTTTTISTKTVEEYQGVRKK